MLMKKVTIVVERECAGTSLRSAQATKLAVFNDQAADVVMGELREDKEDKGRLAQQSKMSKKDREGYLDPASSINQFGYVGLDLEYESGSMEIEHGFHDRDEYAREGSTTSVQEAASTKLVLETGVEKIEGDQIGVEGGKLKTGHGKGGLTWQGKCATLTPPMLGHEIKEELVAKNQAATLPAVTLNRGTGVYVDDDGAEEVDERTRDRDDIVNNSGMSFSTKGTTLTKRQGELLEHDEEVVGKRVVDDGGSDKNEGSKRNRNNILEEQILENRKTWDLALESGAILYNEEDDIMVILQSSYRRREIYCAGEIELYCRVMSAFMGDFNEIVQVEGRKNAVRITKF
ncbi:hypothetical protein AHAS_Ahas18G0236800 [Arachis hypogaea]